MNLLGKIIEIGLCLRVVHRQRSQQSYNGGIKGTGEGEWVLSATVVVHWRLILFASVVEQAAIYIRFIFDADTVIHLPSFSV
jgi:hypothetical protein